MATSQYKQTDGSRNWHGIEQWQVWEENKKKGGCCKEKKLANKHACRHLPREEILFECSKYSNSFSLKFSIFDITLFSTDIIDKANNFSWCIEFLWKVLKLLNVAKHYSCSAVLMGIVMIMYCFYSSFWLINLWSNGTNPLKLQNYGLEYKRESSVSRLIFCILKMHQKLICYHKKHLPSIRRENFWSWFMCLNILNFLNNSSTCWDSQKANA